MKVREIVDCLFVLCSIGDAVDTVVTKMEVKKTSYAIVVDADNKYKGIITAISLIGYMHQNRKIDLLVRKAEAILENNDIKNLKKVDFNIVPVVNLENNVVGVISMTSFVQYMSQDEILKLQKVDSVQCKINSKLYAKYTIDDIIGGSKAVLRLKEQIIAAAKTKSTVLITGDTGTGKELVAQAIVNLSNRRQQPFMRINCAAIAENLLESELFGYEEGAFTGAIKGGRSGKFLMADGGTIFLDEIGDMQFPLQAKILRVLQEREIEKVGGQFPIPINVRIIAATHADLLKMVNEKKFRQDLFYRLHVIPINIPPLHKRKEDIPLLVDYYIRKFTKENDMEGFKVDPTFVKGLVDYDWPGNIRELLNVLETVCSMSNGCITHEDVPQYMYHHSSFDNMAEESINNLKISTDEGERNMIINSLMECKGNKNEVAKHLGISRSNLYYKIKKLKIDIS